MTLISNQKINQNCFLNILNCISGSLSLLSSQFCYLRSRCLSIAPLSSTASPSTHISSCEFVSIIQSADNEDIHRGRPIPSLPRAWSAWGLFFCGRNWNPPLTIENCLEYSQFIVCDRGNVFGAKQPIQSYLYILLLPTSMVPKDDWCLSSQMHPGAASS